MARVLDAGSPSSSLTANEMIGRLAPDIPTNNPGVGEVPMKLAKVIEARHFPRYQRGHDLSRLLHCQSFQSVARVGQVRKISRMSLSA